MVELGRVLTYPALEAWPPSEQVLAFSGHTYVPEFPLRKSSVSVAMLLTLSLDEQFVLGRTDSVISSLPALEPLLDPAIFFF